MFVFPDRKVDVDGSGPPEDGLRGAWGKEGA
jgi:hypothetical protein